MEAKLSRQTSLREHPSLVALAVEDTKALEAYRSVTRSVDSELRNCVWVGHTNTDTDSVASAIAAAHLFEGTAARASETLNRETCFVLSKFKFSHPKLFKELDDQQKKRVCLVDHNQTTQMAEGLDQRHVCAIFDHHAIQKNVVNTDAPITVEIKPWGSTCTIISQMYLHAGKHMPQSIGGLLLGGILSDTLNLRSPTTTVVDRAMVAYLSEVAHMSKEEADSFAMDMFREKTLAVNDLPAHALVVGDHKVFSLQDLDKDAIKLGFGVVETTSPSDLLARKAEILQELRAVRKEMGLTFSFFAVVDTLRLESMLFVSGQSESKLASLAFPEANFLEEGVLNMGSRVSRKLDFIPAIDVCLQSHNFELSEIARVQASEDASTEYGTVVVDHCGQSSGNGGCCLPKRQPPRLNSVAKSVWLTRTLSKPERNKSVFRALIFRTTVFTLIAMATLAKLSQHTVRHSTREVMSML